mmetsp:Transcript_2134/g.4870  ORF Transcript_2134/g.4870 Transcript_2134/m.4870 type:complete len:343 (+) Transcript_2134:316-1344(+)
MSARCSPNRRMSRYSCRRILSASESSPVAFDPAFFFLFSRVSSSSVLETTCNKSFAAVRYRSTTRLPTLCTSQPPAVLFSALASSSASLPMSPSLPQSAMFLRSGSRTAPTYADGSRGAAFPVMLYNALIRGTSEAIGAMQSRATRMATQSRHRCRAARSSSTTPLIPASTSFFTSSPSTSASAAAGPPVRLETVRIIKGISSLDTRFPSRPISISSRSKSTTFSAGLHFLALEEEEDEEEDAAAAAALESNSGWPSPSAAQEAYRRSSWTVALKNRWVSLPSQTRGSQHRRTPAHVPCVAVRRNSDVSSSCCCCFFFRNSVGGALTESSSGLRSCWYRSWK